MHARNLAELAARIVLTTHQPLVAQHRPAVDLVKLYWSASRCRLAHWQKAIKQLSTELQDNDPWHDSWPATRAVVEEILVSETLTRVWSAVIAHFDWQNSDTDLTGLANGVFVAHLEATNRAIRLLMLQNEARQINVSQLNEFRRRLERWTDMILGALPQYRIAARFSFDRNRMLDFAIERGQQTPAQSARANQLFLASLVADLRANTGKFSANPQLNRQIAAGLMDALLPDQFDSMGILKSDFLHRMSHGSRTFETAFEQQERIDEGEFGVSGPQADGFPRDSLQNPPHPRKADPNSWGL